jgi:hypothetical protein
VFVAILFDDFFAAVTKLPVPIACVGNEFQSLK